MDLHLTWILGVCAHLGGSVILALFYLLLARHEARPYLGEWTAAWVAQTLALAVLLATEGLGFTTAVILYLFLETAHGLLLCDAALIYAGSPLSWRARGLVLGSLAAWAATAPFAFGDEVLVIIEYLVVAGTALAAAAILWPRRHPEALGVRLASQVLALLAVVYLLEAAFHWTLPHVPAPLVLGVGTFLGVAPFLVLFLQMLLGLAMLLGVMESAHAALSASNVQLREAQHQLQVLADTDPLTGCFNRRVFRELVDRLRHGDGAPRGALLLVDMDGLKAINDRSGHEAGDAAIRRLAELLRERARTTDLLVRWGGDEFVLVLPGATAADADTRRREVERALDRAGLPASVGRAVYGDGREVMEAVQEADRDMYQVKAARKARSAE